MSYIYIKNDLFLEEVNQETIENTTSNAQNKPKQWLINKLEWLRKLYKKFLDQANKEKNENRIGVFKNILRVILNAVDKLVMYLQEKLGANSNDQSEDVIASAPIPKELKDFIQKRRAQNEFVNNEFKNMRTEKFMDYYETKENLRDTIDDLKNKESHGNKLSDEEKEAKSDAYYKLNKFKGKEINFQPKINIHRFRKEGNIRDGLVQNRSDIIRSIKHFRRTGTFGKPRRQMLMQDPEEDWN